MARTLAAAALLVCAAPVAAQEPAAPVAAVPEPAAESPALPLRPQVQPHERAPEPRLAAEVDRWQDVRAAEDVGQEAAAQQIGSRNWIYLAAAIAAGIIVAAIIL